MDVSLLLATHFELSCIFSKQKCFHKQIYFWKNEELKLPECLNICVISNRYLKYHSSFTKLMDYFGCGDISDTYWRQVSWERLCRNNTESSSPGNKESRTDRGVYQELVVTEDSKMIERGDTIYLLPSDEEGIAKNIQCYFILKPHLICAVCFPLCCSFYFFSMYT